MLGIYISRHAQALFSSLGRMARQPVATILTVLVIGLALALPMGLKIMVDNALAATGGFGAAMDISVYFKGDVPLARAQALAHTARAHEGIASVSVISADDALKEFQKYSGFGNALDALQSNPLPSVLHVHPSDDASTPQDLDHLKQYFAAWPETDLVQLDAEWVLRFNAILMLLQRILAVTAAVLALGVLAIIGNTIRLEIQNRRTEIEVVKLVGGSNAFVRRPFLYTGTLYGLTGALLAWGIVVAALLVLAQPVATLAQLYGSHFSLGGPQLADVGALLGGGLALGWLGAWVSAARHLRSIEPRA